MNNAEILSKEILQSYALGGELSGRYPEAAGELLNLADTNGRFKAQDILNIWQKHIQQPRAEGSGEPADGWLMHTYLYLRNQLFPHLPLTLNTQPDPGDYSADRDSLLKFFRAVYRYERKVCAFDPTKDMLILSDAEIRDGGFIPGYIKLKKLIRSLYIYEFMRIGADITPFNTLGHISGVHYVAMYTARQLYDAGVPVDLGLISAAAASHDIGKYGCRKHEENRVPYLHYYYTDYCLNRYKLPVIAQDRKSTRLNSSH